jgi:hypothetical protein
MAEPGKTTPIGEAKLLKGGESKKVFEGNY